MSRSTTRRLLAKTIVDRCSPIRSSSRRSIAGQIEPSRRGPERSNGAITSRSRSFRRPASTIVTGSTHRRPCQSSEIARDLVQRALRRRQPDPDEPGRIDRFEAFQQESQEDASLVRAEGVNLVDDDVRERIECRSCPTREHQVQGFGRRDQDVGRLPDAAADVRSGGCRRSGRRRSAARNGAPDDSAVSRIPSRGSWRLRKMSLLRAFKGET